MREKLRYKDKLTSEMGENPNATNMKNLTQTRKMGIKLNEKITLYVKEEKFELFEKYLHKLVDRDDHLNQSLRYQFYCEDLDFNYTANYNNEIGFEFADYLKGDENEIGNFLSPENLYERLAKIKSELLSTGSISEDSIFYTDLIFTLYIKTQILPALKTIMLVNTACIKPPMNLFSNPPKGMSDFMIRLGKNSTNGYYLRLNDKDLCGFSMMENVMN